MLSLAQHQPHILIPRNRCAVHPPCSNPSRSNSILSFFRPLWLRLAAILTVTVLALAGTCQAQTSVEIAWDSNPEADIAGFYVYLGTTPGNLPLYLNVTNGTSATLSGLLPSTTYYCALQAYNLAGLKSSLSEIISFTTRPPEPLIVVKNSFGAPLTSGGAASAGNVRLGSLEIHRFTIHNEGTLDLTGLGITCDGPQRQDFSVSAPATTSLAPGASTEFTVTFAPSAAGSRTAGFRIASNDPVTPAFDVSITGNSGTDLQLYAQWAAANLLTGTAAQPSAMPFKDEVKNVLKYAFNLAGNRPDRRTLTSSVGTAGLPVFTLDRSGPTPVFKAEYLQRRNSGLVYTPKISTDLSDFEPMTGSTTVTPIDENWSRVILRKTMDPATSPALFGILEVTLPEFTPAPAPEIAVTHSGSSGMKSNASVLSFGPVRIGGPSSTRTITITNEGSAPLTGIALSQDGPHQGEFIHTPIAQNFLDPGASMSFDVTFLPAIAGTRTSALHIHSSDTDESPFIIALAADASTAADLYALWAAAANFSGAHAAASATPFNDGVENLLKYAFNLPAGTSSSRVLTRATGTSGLPAISVDWSGAQPQLVIEFLRRKNSGLIYTPKSSATLANFEPITETPNVTSISDHWERVVVKKTLDPTQTPTLFGRVDVTLP